MLLGWEPHLRATGDTVRGGSWPGIPGLKPGRDKSGSGKLADKSHSVEPDPW